MFIIRWLVGRLILLFNFVFSPSSPQLTPQQKQLLAEKTAGLSLYQLPACPFCVKVRRAIKRQGLNIPLRNIHEEKYKNELVSLGGKRTVPCLRIEHADDQIEWLYESNDIIAYLSKIKV